MSSSVLTDIQRQIDLYGYPILTILGTIGNVFIVVLFNKQRQNPCAIYLTSSAIMNILFLISSALLLPFPISSNNGTIGVIIICKILPYIRYILGQIAKTMVILACMDRYLITSDRATFRAFSTPKRAKLSIFFTSIFWSLFGIYIPIMQTLIYGQCTTSGINSIIFSVFALLFVSGTPVIILSVFGYLTYRNMRKMQLRVQPVVHNANDQNHPVQRKDQALLIIVMAEVLVYVITTILLPLISIEMMISGYTLPNKSNNYILIELFIFKIGVFLISINSALSFYIYLISSKAFHRDFKQLITNAYRKVTRQSTVSTISATRRRVAQQETHV